MKRQRRLTCFTLGYTQVALIFPLAVVSPRYFAKQIGWGGLMQVVSAFSFVQNSLSFIINACTDIAAWQGSDATAKRLRTAIARNPSIKACTAADHYSTPGYRRCSRRD
jgi:putative ATP-binding cassette transporter